MSRGIGRGPMYGKTITWMFHTAGGFWPLLVDLRAFVDMDKLFRRTVRIVRAFIFPLLEPGIVVWYKSTLVWPFILVLDRVPNEK